VLHQLSLLGEGIFPHKPSPFLPGRVPLQLHIPPNKEEALHDAWQHHAEPIHDAPRPLAGR
jgi:hypothetical protein